MASVYQKRGTWYLSFKDREGCWQTKASGAETKTEAKRLAMELERAAERQRLGIDPIPEAPSTETLGSALKFWLESYSRTSASHDRNEYSVRKHLLSAPEAKLLLRELTAGRIEAFLLRKHDELSPQSINHLRGFIGRAIEAAISTGRFAGPNPVAQVRKRKVPRRAPEYLRAWEVPMLLGALESRWRPLFATAIATGMRKGELLGLRKGDVDLRSRHLLVTRSHGRDMTKGGRAAVIPISDELLSYLQTAMNASPSELVFPAEGGRPMRRDVALESVLRRAMARAGIVTSYHHVCRRPGCSHAEDHADCAIRRCPTDNAKLWPKAVVRPIRFHDLRHTTASLFNDGGC